MCTITLPHPPPLPPSLVLPSPFSSLPLPNPSSNLREVIHSKLLTTHMEEARKKEHLKEVTQRQQSAEQQILKLEAELTEEQKKKEDLVSGQDDCGRVWLGV